MANTFDSGLIIAIFQAWDVVLRELIGFIPAVDLDASSAQAAVGQSISFPKTQAQAAQNVVPGVTAPDTGDQTINLDSMTIDKSRFVPIRWNGEEQLGYSKNGTYNQTLSDQFAQAMRTLLNEVESDIADEYARASRAYGVAGTTPFASSLEDAAQIKKIFDDNGVPMGDRTLIINTSAGVNLRKLANLSSVDAAGTDRTLRDGILLDMFGLGVRESAQIKSHTKGTGTGYLIDLVAGYPVGTTTIHVDTGTGTILAGDIITIGSDTNKYVVTTGFAGDGDGDIVIAEPGLRVAAIDNAAVTIGANYTANLAVQKNAVKLVTRAPAMPVDMNGNPMDGASALMNLTDPVTGLTMRVSEYKQHKQILWMVELAWGVRLNKQESGVILLG